jgi:hypothetical protein
MIGERNLYKEVMQWHWLIVQDHAPCYGGELLSPEEWNRLTYAQLNTLLVFFFSLEAQFAAAISALLSLI